MKNFVKNTLFINYLAFKEVRNPHIQSARNCWSLLENLEQW